MDTYIVYKTVNTVNGKYYIGKHKQTSDTFDGYFGSSEVVNYAIQKYGVDAFERITLTELDNEDECYLAEENAVGDLWRTDKKCYNKQPGGKGFSSGADHYTQGNGFTDPHKENLKKARKKRAPASAETRAKMSASRTGSKRSAETKKKMSVKQSGKNNPMFGKKHSADKRQLISEALTGKYTGTNNANFKGYYVTPFGKFTTVKDISNNVENVSKQTVYSWCKNSEKIITANMVGMSKFLTCNDIGKTFKEIGFYMEPK